MNRIHFQNSLFALVAIGALTCSSAFANPIGVINSSFETLPGGGLPFNCGVGCSYSDGDLIPGWSGTGVPGTGQFQPGSSFSNFTFFNSVPDGITTAYSKGATIFQTVVPTVQLGVTYTLQVDLGQRNDLPLNASANLLINGNIINALGVAPGAGDWSTFTAVYTGLAGDVGQSITIELVSSGLQANFDNVRLSDDIPDDAAPEPTTAAIFTFGLAGILAFARRKRIS